MRYGNTFDSFVLVPSEHIGFSGIYCMVQEQAYGIKNLDDGASSCPEHRCHQVHQVRTDLHVYLSHRFKTARESAGEGYRSAPLGVCHSRGELPDDPVL